MTPQESEQRGRAPLDQEAPATSQPVGTAERALAPDLARGAMLLLIALANTPWYLYGAARESTSVHPVDGSAIDAVVQTLLIVAVDSRIYPLFAFLFGYGIVQLYSRQLRAGVDERSIRAVLRRRHLWMIAFGFAHAALLWMGDIVGAYGLVGLILVALFLRRSDRAIRLWAMLLTILLAGITVLAAISIPFIPAEAATQDDFLGAAVEINGEQDYLTSILLRLSFWPFIVLGQGILGLVVPIAILVAFLAARHQVLERPGEHLPLLRRTAALGVAIGIVGGVPQALQHLGVLAIPEHVSWILGLTQTLTGLFGGLGYVALFTLIAHRIQSRSDRLSVPVVALRAVGKRSLSSYLGQSVIFAPLLAAWGFGLGGWIGSAQVALIAVGGWLVLAALAYRWERRGSRGPAESVLRRLAYGPRTRTG